MLKHFSKNKLVNLGFLILIFMVTSSGISQPSPVGIFDGSTDIGNCLLKGSSVYNPETKEYTISGSGADIWDRHDAFHFLWKKMKGDFILQFDFSFVGKAKNMGRKVGWMVRNDTTDNSAHINAMVHNHGLTCIQYRQKKGDVTHAIDSKATVLDIVKFERRGNLYILSTAANGQDFISIEFNDLTKFINDEAFVGIFICSHEHDTKETAIIQNVTISIPKKKK